MSEPNFDAMTYDEFEEYPDCDAKRDYRLAIYRAENERHAALIAARRGQV